MFESLWVVVKACLIADRLLNLHIELLVSINAVRFLQVGSGEATKCHRGGYFFSIYLGLPGRGCTSFLLCSAPPTLHSPTSLINYHHHYHHYNLKSSLPPGIITLCLIEKMVLLLSSTYVSLKKLDIMHKNLYELQVIWTKNYRLIDDSNRNRNHLNRNRLFQFDSIIKI